LNAPTVHWYWPDGHAQLPPGPEHVSPITRQSLLLQHVLFGMHALLTVQTFAPTPHVHMPPAIGQNEFVTGQSAAVQHRLFAMHELVTMHA
jgi:hypothetical protein